jgi:type IV secretory pathway VirB2 component (pilin)
MISLLSNLIAHAEQGVVIPSVPGEINSVEDLIQIAGRVLLWASFVIAVFCVIMVGIQFMLSTGDSNKFKKALNWLLYSVIGLAISLSANAIIDLVIKSLK